MRIIWITVKKLSELSDKFGTDYVGMIFVDTLVVANPDRHTFNYGILREVNTGEVLGFALNFDNSIALISRGYPTNIARKNDAFVRLFHKLLDHRKDFRNLMLKVN